MSPSSFYIRNPPSITTITHSKTTCFTIKEAPSMTCLTYLQQSKTTCFTIQDDTNTLQMPYLQAVN